MAAQSAGSRTLSANTAEIFPVPLAKSANSQSISSVLDLFLSARGPHSQTKVIHNNCGGQVEVTTDSSRLLKSLTMNEPALKLIMEAVKAHLTLYSDSGLFCVVLSLLSVKMARRICPNQRLASDVYDLALKKCLEILHSETFPCRLDLDYKQRNVIMLKLIKSQYKSKPACLLYKKDFDHLCHLTFTTVQTYDDLLNKDPTLLYMNIIGRPPQQSELLPGVLFEMPQIPSYRRDPLTVGRIENGQILIALIQMSMAGDSEAFLDVKYEIQSEVDLAQTILDQLMVFASAVVDNGVGMVVCQKVVHPVIKKFLKGSGIVVLDRLGTVNFNALHRLAGGQILDPFSSVSKWSFSSQLSAVELLVLNNKSYVHLSSQSHSGEVYTVLLCHRTEQALLELRAVFEKCQHLSRVLYRDSRVLCGGGCWQSALCLHLTSMITTLAGEWSIEIGTSKTQVSQILKAFISCLTRTILQLNRDPTNSVVDTSSGHLFRLDNNGRNIVCQCGAVSYASLNDCNFIYIQSLEAEFLVPRPSRMVLDCLEVPDVFCSELGALRTAVSVSSMILGIHNYIKDPT